MNVNERNSEPDWLTRSGGVFPKRKSVVTGGNTTNNTSNNNKRQNSNKQTITRRASRGLNQVDDELEDEYEKFLMESKWAEGAEILKQEHEVK